MRADSQALAEKSQHDSECAFLPGPLVDIRNAHHLPVAIRQDPRAIAISMIFSLPVFMAGRSAPG
jgi:hypothetical protein